MVLPFAILSAIVSTTVSSTDCDDYYECSGQTFNDRVNCYGYSSCSEAIIESDHGLKCDGDRSCYMSQLNLGEAIKCRATASCEAAMIMTDDEVYCEGVASCSNAQIMEASKVYLYGHYAAANTAITQTSTVRAYGYYALLYGSIDSSNIPSLSVKVYGADSGYGANVICRSRSVCSLTCKGGACDSLDFLCMNGATCSLPTGCMEDNSVTTTDGGITCPNVIISDSDDGDAAIEQFMVDKEETKTSDKKWSLYTDYIADDLSLWELRDLDVSLSDNEKVFMDKVSVGTVGYLKNFHFVIVGLVMSAIIFAVFWFYVRAKNENYQKV